MLIKQAVFVFILCICLQRTPHTHSVRDCSKSVVSRTLSGKRQIEQTIPNNMYMYSVHLQYIVIMHWILAQRSHDKLWALLLLQPRQNERNIANMLTRRVSRMFLWNLVCLCEYTSFAFGCFLLAYICCDRISQQIKGSTKIDLISFINTASLCHKSV